MTRNSKPKLLGRYARPLWRRLLLLTLAVLTASALQLLGPQIVRFVIDGAAAQTVSMSTLVLAAGLFLAVGAANVVIAAASSYLSSDVGWRATNRLRSDLLTHALELDLSFHEARTPGELIERIDADSSSLFRFFSVFVIGVLSNALLLIGVLVVLFRQRWWLGVGLGVFAGVMVLVLASVRARAAPHYRASREAAGRQTGFMAEWLGGIDDITTNAAVPYVMSRFLQVAVAAYRAAKRARVLGDALGGVGSSMLKLGTIGALAAGVYLHQAGDATIGSVYMIVQYAAMLSRPLEVVSGQADELQRARVSGARVAELLAAESTLKGGHEALPAGPLALEVSGVSFGYGAGPNVLDDVTFALQPGEVLGLIGRTGAGKSTISRLLLRLHDPTSGTIRLGGSDLRGLSRDALRSHVGAVTQEVQLFNASVRDNLTLFDKAADDDRLLRAIESLGLSQWFARLPEGLDTAISGSGGEGLGLSGGEAQLLALTRLFLQDPGLIVLDEASSKLDPVTERAMSEALTRLLRGRTAVVIAHRLSTIRRVDTVLVLESGRVEEFGPRAELEREPSSRLSALLKLGAAT